ncbi:MAG: AbrB/MazE/SpoVT family DNA-binding domain-containing protein [Betaproteobacteria bacterium]|nr:AbrB/MazE/SpoVT family DNA-binding domain-containing protein [Betaproteobacteria bacterium]
MKAVVAERGQVTIPKPLRDRLGIRPGTALEFSAQNGTLVARKAETDPVSRVFGCLGGRVDTDRFIRAMRGDAKK